MWGTLGLRASQRIGSLAQASEPNRNTAFPDKRLWRVVGGALPLWQ